MTVASDRIGLPAGTPLFGEGDAGDFAYLIMAGEIEISIRRAGRDVIVGRRGPGEVIGELALIDGRTRSASARVTADCELVVVSSDQIASRIAESDPVLRICLDAVIERFRDTQVALDAASLAAPPTPRAGRSIDGTFRAAVDTLTLERQLTAALANGELVLYLQPIVDMRDGGIAGFEALVRWNHPTRGLLAPGLFIPAAESTGQVVHVTQWMVGQVAAALPRLIAAAGGPGSGRAPLFVSVNVSAHDLLRPLFAEMVQRTLAEAGILSHHLRLEVTEGMLMKDPAGAARVLDACRRQGMGIAIDDFGTGYSNLSYIGSLPLTCLKLDRSFVSSMSTDPTSRKIVGTVQHLARELGLAVVAEGIEREAEAALLGEMRCEYGQGYLFGRPGPLGEALDLLGERGPSRPWRRIPIPGRSSRPPLETAGTR